MYWYREQDLRNSVYVDATKTIHAPYCQGNVTVFGENAGQQCVAMSLCTLIYSKITKITSVDEMTQIMCYSRKSPHPHDGRHPGKSHGRGG